MWERLLDFLFPAQCGACGDVGSGFCDVCATELRDLCEMRGELKVRGLGSYHGSLRRAVLALKDGRRDVVCVLATRLAALAPAGSALVPIPTTRARRRVRGTDGVVEIARAMGKYKPLTLCHVLEHAKNDAQRGRSRDARLRAQGRFRVSRRFSGERLVLVDDVCTTGATLNDCAAALREAGAIVDGALVLAIARDAYT